MRKNDKRRGSLAFHLRLQMFESSTPHQFPGVPTLTLAAARANGDVAVGTFDLCSSFAVEASFAEKHAAPQKCHQHFAQRSNGIQFKLIYGPLLGSLECGPAFVLFPGFWFPFIHPGVYWDASSGRIRDLLLWPKKAVRRGACLYMTPPSGPASPQTSFNGGNQLQREQPLSKCKSTPSNV